MDEVLLRGWIEERKRADKRTGPSGAEAAWAPTRLLSKHIDLFAFLSKAKSTDGHGGCMEKMLPTRMFESRCKAAIASIEDRGAAFTAL
jgi:hypothetical protein